MSKAHLAEMDEFAYHPLDSTAGDIRTIRILPGKDDDLLCCTLSHQPLEEYTCLSYTWGEPPASRCIAINGKIFRIRVGLHDFLCSARRYGVTESLWIDAICINQSDNIEKSEQVRRMGQIYGESKCVIIWLGLDDEAAQRLGQMYHKILSMAAKSCDVFDSLFHGLPCEVNGWQHLRQSERSAILERIAIRVYRADLAAAAAATPSHDTTGDSTAIHDSDKISSRELDGRDWFTDSAAELCSEDFHFLLMKIHQASYWKRAWIVQEVYCGTRIQFLSTSSRINFWDLFAFLRVHMREYPGAKGQHIYYPIAINRKFERIRSRINTLHVGPLSAALEINPDAGGCHEARDRIYSVLSFVKSGQCFNVDYNVSLKHVFSDAVTFAGQHPGVESGSEVSLSIDAVMSSTDCASKGDYFDYCTLSEQCTVAQQAFEALALSPPGSHQDLHETMVLQSNWPSFQGEANWVSDYARQDYFPYSIGPTKGPYAGKRPNIGICVGVMQGDARYLSWPVHMTISNRASKNTHCWWLDPRIVTVWSQHCSMWSMTTINLPVPEKARDEKWRNEARAYLKALGKSPS